MRGANACAHYLDSSCILSYERKYIRLESTDDFRISKHFCCLSLLGLHLILHAGARHIQGIVVKLTSSSLWGYLSCFHPTRPRWWDLCTPRDINQHVILQWNDSYYVNGDGLLHMLTVWPKFSWYDIVESLSSPLCSVRITEQLWGTTKSVQRFTPVLLQPAVSKSPVLEPSWSPAASRYHCLCDMSDLGRPAIGDVISTIVKNMNSESIGGILEGEGATSWTTC